MSADELQIPRYEMTANFPDALIIVGEIITGYKGISVFLTEGSMFDVREYPHLFRKMDWWEKRALHEMPKRLMFSPGISGHIFEIEEWDMDTFVGWVDKKVRCCCSLLSWPSGYGYVPVG